MEFFFLDTEDHLFPANGKDTIIKKIYSFKWPKNTAINVIRLS